MTNAINNDLYVLITDDIEQNRVYFVEILREICPNLVVIEAGDGKEAVAQVEAFIKKRGTSPNLIIMDYQMPVLNGAEATAAIRQVETKLSPSQQSIIITWSTSMHSAYKQADGWLPKMTNVREVKAMLLQFGLLQGS